MAHAILPAGYWGRRPWWHAKIGTGSSRCVLIKRQRSFSVDQRIQFCTLDELRGMATGGTPRWTGGIIWKIEDDRLFINKH